MLLCLLLCLSLINMMTVVVGEVWYIVPMLVGIPLWVMIFVLLSVKDIVAKKQTIEVVTGLFCSLLCIAGPMLWMEPRAGAF